MYHSVSLIKAIELYTLNGWLISYKLWVGYVISQAF